MASRLRRGRSWLRRLAVTFALVAGIRSVAWTDALQVLVMLVTVDDRPCCWWWARSGRFRGAFRAAGSEEHPGVVERARRNGYFSISVFVGLTLPWFFFSLSNPQVSQRLFMLGNDAEPAPDAARVSRDRLYLHAGGGFVGLSRRWCGFRSLEAADLATPSLSGVGTSCRRWWRSSSSSVSWRRRSPR